MNFHKRILKTYYKEILLSLLLSSIVGCGGGGGDSGAASPAPVVEAPVAQAPTPIVTSTEPEVSTAEFIEETSGDYSPDSDKLDLKAGTSTELYVEPAFNFDSFKSVSFDISVTDHLNQPVQDVMLSISVIDAEITSFDDPLLQDKSLLTKVFTDANGQIYVTLEMSRSVSKVLLELHILGVENDVIMPIDDSGIVIHHFQ